MELLTNGGLGVDAEAGYHSSALVAHRNAFQIIELGLNAPTPERLRDHEQDLVLALVYRQEDPVEQDDPEPEP